ncbi:MAG: HAD-IC family P-type ATPase [Microcoleus sp. PH2017_29_MFU_D_A]|uniref:cation-translocating P-type ATPase n=1 Tax=unclassified Microcoleus TaxID=2642155 RepID=UPI001DCAAB03|nr:MULTISPECIES: HAD-IC family P-type ATPase [unclassified Microcoleus]MCC3569761.1 HAD-IC family P-type ATPase [Microcoleus sp. PH2017_31_RDM_U_A]MCC3582197.1 HAD-IC family P-type ATPase [Microcoleus sp. PH2017_32_RDM_D_A]MCC3606654.1 HAD-IC family P-type ATPase [Microcoleus sp. PH2017_29_MFU_D_A]MCC3620063.1 HAD-IC family P-type ATPase [Microcoleus sp. PH2017_38_RDM_U_B]MCC3637700.1 HAD-IC family P-type ATPase [Microcoleus sp. PH2017_37_MFU_D_B]
MVATFDPNTAIGLSELNAIARLKDDGYNELPSAESRNLLSIAWNTIQDPIFLLLVGGGIIYWILGDLQEALILIGFVLFITGISLYQEGKTEHALEALRDLSSPRALVIRDGERKRIAGREVVRGDFLVLAEGDRVSADAIVLSCSNLSTDESLLTGESLPVRKVTAVGNVEMARPGGDELPFVYSGTLVVQGQGIVQVKAIGAQTEMGKIGKALQKIKPETTPLQQEMNRLVSRLFGIALSLCVAIVVIYGFTTGDWLKGVLAGITLAMAILPNEFPVVVTIFLALGAWRISQNHVLARRASAVETVGSATVLCVDKTGTLTQNQMAVQQLLAYNQAENPQPYDLGLHSSEALPEAVHQLVEFCILASQRDPFDPMEKAFKQLGDRYLAHTEHLHSDWKLLREYPLSPHLLAMSHVWESADRKLYEVAAKGAPEAIADLCHFTPQQQQMMAAQVSQMASQGLRVLGVAKASLVGAPPPFLPPHPSLNIDRLPEKQHDFPFEFIGLVGLSDPVRPTVKAAIQECYSAGIRVVMITGDYPETAQSIARQVGLMQMGAIVTGAELDGMSDAELEQRIQSTNIFARAVPEHKLRLVNALKSKGEVVAMTGDGVNDAPALKAAQIGIAMGERGTDVARESAALVLLDDDFSSIVQAVKLGRRIFDNLRKAMSYLIAIHIPIAGMSLIPVLFKLPLVLLPVHVAFLHLIIDPACSIVLEAEPAEATVMQRPPRNPKEPLFGKKTLSLAVLQGGGILAIVLAIFAIALYRRQGEFDARALTFTTLILANLGLILSSRFNLAPQL